MMPRNKIQKEKCLNIEGQLSIWDVDVIKKLDPVTVIEKVVTEKSEYITEIITTIHTRANNNSINSLELTTMQYEFLIKNDIKKNDNLSRLIIYCGGGLGIEFKEEAEFRTKYINKDGKEEFEVKNKLSVLPMDHIFYYKVEFKINDLQQNNLKNLLENEKLRINRVIHRKGDENILIELQENKVLSLIPNGWILEFNINKVDYNENELLSLETNKGDIKEMQKNIKCGDIVKAYYGKELILGVISSVYGPGNVTLNIIYDNGTKHTAICRSCISSLINGASKILCNK